MFIIDTTLILADEPMRDHDTTPIITTPICFAEQDKAEMELLTKYTVQAFV
jgi:hypothetical protein